MRQGYQPMPVVSDGPLSVADLRAPGLREVLQPGGGAGTASCNPGELHGPHLGLLLIRLQDD